VLGVAATLACNVAYGLPHGWPGALVSGWPAVSFVMAAEVAISMSARRPARRPAAKRPAPDTTGPPVTGTQAAVMAALAADPAASDEQLAAVVGRSARTVRRYRAMTVTANGAASR
jgi:hypothetical protein